MTMGDKIYKAFVSSTFIDLKEHRAHVINSLRNAGFFVDPMENWAADNDEPKKFSQDRLNGCDLCVLLVAFRRGYVPDGETRSITQLEYDAAVKQGVEILPFLLDENEPWPRKFDELDKDSEARLWRNHLRQKHGTALFKLDPHSIDLFGALSRWLVKKQAEQHHSGSPTFPLYGQSLPQTDRLSDMVKVPEGSFLYGDQGASVVLDHGYWIDQYPVTNERYRAFIEAGGYENQQNWSQDGWKWKIRKEITGPEYWDDEEWNKADHPVVGVSYYEAEAYAKWAGRRLPTEQEWEKAARGDKDGRQYPWGEEFNSHRCNSNRSGIGHTTPVTKYPNGASPYGCYDMVGNAWEWCSSWSNENQDQCVLRGGSWFNGPERLRVSNRYVLTTVHRDHLISFRLAHDLP